MLIKWLVFYFILESASAGSIAIETQTISLEDKTAHLSFLGAIQAKNIALVQAKTAGPVKTIYFFPGDKVKFGDILLEMDDVTQKVKLDVAQEVLAKATSALAAETFNFDQANVLFTKKAISESSFKLQTANYQSTKSAYNNAKSNFDLAKLNSSYTTVRSPISGTVSEKKVFQNSLIEVGSPLFVITDSHQLVATIPVPEHERPLFSEGLGVKITNLSTKKIITAKIKGIGATIDQQNHCFDVYVDFDNPGGWYPGNTIKAEFYLNKIKAFRVPQLSIVFNRGFPEVFIIEGNRAKPISVKELFFDQTNVWVQGALKTGMKIATIGASNLFDTAKVYIKPSDNK